MSQAGRAVLPSLSTREEVQGFITGLAGQLGVGLDDKHLAAELDKQDQLAELRGQFHVPRVGDLLDKGEEMGVV